MRDKKTNKLKLRANEQQKQTNLKKKKEEKNSLNHSHTKYRKHISQITKGDDSNRKHKTEQNDTISS